MRTLLDIIHKTYFNLHGRLPNIHVDVVGKARMRTLTRIDTARGAADNKTNRIWILEDSEEAMAIVAGHEIGHLIKPKYYSQSIEETKAYLYQFGWMRELLHTMPEGREEINHYTREFKRRYTPENPLAQRALARARAYAQRAGSIPQALDALYQDNREFHTLKNDQIPLHWDAA